MKLAMAFNDNFTSPLYMTLAANTSTNIIISPFNLHIILSLVSNGAGGSTLEEMRAALGYVDTEETLNDKFQTLIVLLNEMENVTLHAVNAAYIQKEVELIGDFLSMCINIFKSSISKINFEDNIHAAKIINSWVEATTYNKITNIISPSDISKDTKIMLVSAVYFNSRWLKPFNKNDTHNGMFRVSTKEIYPVSTMFIKGTFFYGEVPIWNTQFIEIPYFNDNIVMIVLLPHEGTELKDLEEKFDWQTLIKTRRFSDDFELYLPKFKFEISINLKDNLSKIGMNKMFTDGCDLTRLSKFSLKVSDVVQKIFIEVNEEGTEAGVVTGVQTRLKRMVISPMKFMVNRPFMFAIEHKPSETALFLGSMRKIEPSSSVPSKDEL
ncbi:antichymotrypsin-2 isoform X1 [Anoplolepis gracilipes]|uniref:antichymotrypsin-2 isoform X1 n=2 Tax=Anoplolepis gracilipes TaxID=354296 RepID=UPI003BA2107E